MGEFFEAVPMLLASTLAGYLLGALPLAHQISRRHGADIFSLGTGLPGASNVFRNVGLLPAAVVLVGDMAKGAVAVLFGQFLGMEGAWLLIPATAAILGHWNSIFSGFRGGDGLAPLGGIMIALFGSYGLVGVIVATVVALFGQKLPYTSLLCIVLGYVAIAMLNLADYGDMTLTVGTGGLSALILIHAVRGHMQRRRSDGWTESGGVDGATEQISP